jgi:hypothetical protein
LILRKSFHLLWSWTSHGKGLSRACLAVGKDGLVNSFERAQNKIFNLLVEDLLRSDFTCEHIVKREHFLGPEVHKRVV